MKNSRHGVSIGIQLPALIDRQCGWCDQIIPWDHVWTHTEYKKDRPIRQFFHKQCAIEFTHQPKLSFIGLLEILFKQQQVKSVE